MIKYKNNPWFLCIFSLNGNCVYKAINDAKDNKGCIPKKNVPGIPPTYNSLSKIPVGKVF